MAQKDYINNVSSTLHKKTNRPIKIGTIILLLVLIALVSSLYFHNKSDKSVIVPIIKKHTGNGLPPRPEERWRYISELENSQIRVHTTTTTNQLLEQINDLKRRTSSLNHRSSVSLSVNKEKLPLWFIQCGSFKDINQAKSVRTKLALSDIESRITTVSGWYRVMLESNPSRTNADQLLHNRHEVRLSNCILLAEGG